MNTINILKTIKFLLPVIYIPKNKTKIGPYGEAIQGLLFEFINKKELRLTVTNSSILIIVKIPLPQVTGLIEIPNDNRSFLIHKSNLQTVIDKFKDNLNLSICFHENQLYFMDNEGNCIITNSIEKEFPTLEKTLEIAEKRNRVIINSHIGDPTLSIDNLMLATKTLKNINCSKFKLKTHGAKSFISLTYNNTICLIMPVEV
jgi:DNA polymerase III sliding clamp (beta) subunit (PCNA family)